MRSRQGMMSLILFMFCSTTSLLGQAVVSGSYKIGQIPPKIGVWRDQSIDITVISPIPNATLAVQFVKPPKGTTSFVSSTGEFKYVPSQDDTAEFGVTFTASSDKSSPVSQTIFVDPLPYLRPDHDYMSSRDAPPDETSGAYLKYMDVVVNNKRNVEIAGRTVVLQTGGKEFGLINYVPPSAGAPANGDVASVKIYGETVVVRSPLLLPGATVEIWARELRFEDPPNTAAANRARIDISPLDFDSSQIPAATKDGGAGTDSGNITLYVQKFTSVPDTSTTPGLKRFFLNGGKGQKAGPGINGSAGNDLRYLIAPNPFPGGSRSFCDTSILGICVSTTTCNWNAFGTNNTIYIDLQCFDHHYDLSGQPGVYPTNGTNATAPGRPGPGGNGGTLTVNLDASQQVDLSPYVVQNGGASGDLAAPAIGGAAGLPNFSQRQHIGNPPPPGETHTATAGTSFAAPPASRISNGGKTVTTPDKNLQWIHPSAARTVLDYVKDVYKTGNLELASAIVKDYLPIFQQRTAIVDPNNADWTTLFNQLQLEDEQLAARLDANLDYYGNRAGWVPLLSLQANMTLLNQEVTAAIPMLYLSYWMENYAQNAQMNIAAINASKNTLWTDIQNARSQYTDAVNTLPGLENEATEIQNEISTEQGSLKYLEQKLTAQAEQNVEDRNRLPFWKAGLRILAGVCKVIPIYQPALGAIGAGLDFVTNIDTNKPLDDYNQGLDIAKQFNSQLFADSNAQLKAQIAKLDPSGQSPADYAKSVAGVYQQFSGALDQLRQSLQPAAAPANEVQVELQKLEAQDSVFQGVIADITNLNTKKATLAKSISDTTDLITKTAQTISSDLITLSELDRTLQKTVKTMDMRTVKQVQQMGRMAQERLEKYLYYVNKSYEYALVLPHPTNVGLDNLKNQIQQMLKDTFTTDPSKFDLALQPYREAIRAVIQGGIDKMQLKTRPQQLPVLFSLTADELKALNTQGEVEIDLSAKLSGIGSAEEKRLNDLRIDDGGITVASNTSSQMFIQMTITGDSVLSTSYTLDLSRQYSYAFRFGTEANPNPFIWTDSYVPSLGRLNHSTDSSQNLTLLKAFLTGGGLSPLPFSDADLSSFFFARPAADTTLRIALLSGSGQITNLRFNADVSFVPGNSTFGVLKVQSPNIGAPLVSLDSVDATGRSTGQGSFTRVFRARQTVTITADSTQGNSNFLQWTDGEGSILSTSPTLKVNVVNAKTVRPIYASGTAAGATPFAVGDLNGASLSTSGSAGATTVGYGKVQANPGSASPSGLAIFGYRNGGVLVSEAGVPDSGLLIAGRIYAEVSSDGTVNTGIAIANPNANTATISFTVQGTNGLEIKRGTTQIGANQQIAYFLDGQGSPFATGRGITGAFSFTSDQPVAVIALRGFTNERGEFLMTTLPVIDTEAPVNVGTQFLAHFADGGGFTTQVLLVNPTNSAMSGSVQFYSTGTPTSAGAPASVNVNGQTASSFPYSIPGNSAQKFRTLGTGNLITGSVRVVPSGGGSAPVPLAVFSYKPGNVTESEAGVPANVATAFRMYAESSGIGQEIGSIQSGVAIANTSTTPAIVKYELFDLKGNPITSNTVTIPASGQTSAFLRQMFSSIPNQLQGVLRISSASKITVVGLRMRVNDRNELLFTTTPPVDEGAPAPSGPRFFPQVADGGGFTTQFILFGSQPGQSTSGSLFMYSQAGQVVTGTIR